MARGWESKSVEDQQEQAKADRSARRSQLTPEQAAAAQRLDELKLARARVVQQLEASRNPRYTEMLRAQLAAIEAEMAKG